MKVWTLCWLSLLSLEGYAFRLGGELVNPRSTLHPLGESGVSIEIPDTWNVESRPNEISASDTVTMDVESRGSRIRLVAGSAPLAVDRNQCDSETEGETTKIFCALDDHRGTLYLLQGEEILASMQFVQGSLSQSRMELNKVLRSLGRGD